ncbi:metallophosphoesterase [Thermococcus sp.]|uniref:metallophosphoesterase n=1 Tax=Thermococcus sp. TaxID=35749 RepID=UPI00262C8AE9|nr:metallophosphoesterase [Thermococcus sp.]
MKLAVVSDTHVGDRLRCLPSPLLSSLEAEKPDLILHAGDVASAEALEVLEDIAPTVAVRGNADRLHLPEEETVAAGDFRIGIIHGHQLFSLNAQSLTLKALEMGVDVLIFGHTHRYYYDSYSLHGRRVTLLNPGSPTFPRFEGPGFAVLKVGGEIEVRRVLLY